MGKIEYYDYKWSTKTSMKPRHCVVKYAEKYLKKGMHVLDFGCGAGRHLKFLLDNGIDAVGTDVSTVAVEKCNKIGLGRAHTMGWHKYGDGEFDAIVCNRVVENNHTEGIRNIFCLFGKVLKKGGTIFLTTRSTNQPLKDGQLERETIIKINEHNGIDVATSALKFADGVEQHYFTEDELQWLFRGAGIEIIKNKLRISGTDAEWQYTGRKL